MEEKGLHDSRRRAEERKGRGGDALGRKRLERETDVNKPSGRGTEISMDKNTTSCYCIPNLKKLVMKRHSVAGYSLVVVVIIIISIYLFIYYEN